MKIKATYEKVTTGFGNSILVRHHTEAINDVIKKSNGKWHFHPEIELVYVNKGKGKRHIGNHLSYFNNSQLMLLGSNLPHYGFTDRLTSNGSETIIQFKPDFLGDLFFDKPEMTNIKQLLERAKQGILFKPETKKEVGPKIQSLVTYEGFERIIKLLEILNELGLSKDYTLLNVDGFAFETEPKDNEKLNIIFKFINNNFKRAISLEEIADKVSMTEPAFCRYLKKATGKTFTRLVNEYRVVHATKLLNESQLSITDVCFESGFNNFSHFNKLFKEITGKSASKYRAEIKHIIQY
ncbi:AraC family transcriptional regulator [Mangrovimonas sp. AS39]|uniref:AraC family transcriptional regulator n=1 Tax=Mangrovimonas TaxID=1211036 RepID=UPI00142362B0|nr:MULTISPECIES: AraC family transcriptional regulator [Mangrovimonas]MCF1190234.1 AraC family transcriptional regulator [Mangrovimonas futianensis]MCF1194013.1 AraC family transcriptional regulator [Mangrovimonas futianensis]MCF1421014.1 AraC family transcriptional regulator [Mangrovimonas futianensis]NIK90783.1 helix-turn-helix transcriptional regulator [Mangrovimonas sp. CR14]